MARRTAERLIDAVRGAAPAVTGLSIGTHGVPSSVAVEPAVHQAAAQPAIDAFDWSDAAQAAWERAREPALRDLLEQADAAIAAIDTYLAVADSATNAQVRAEVKAMDQRQRRVIQALKRLTQRAWRS